MTEKIEGRPRPWIIAELSGNHNGSIERALELIDIAADCGVDAVKFQTYTADTLTIDGSGNEFRIRDKDGVWDGRTLYSIYQEAHTPWDWTAEMAERATKRGMSWLSSPFDLTAVDFLARLKPAALKIASPELIDLPLIDHAASKGIPLILSTGMASLAEIADAVAVVDNRVALTLLKCTTEYPAASIDANLVTLRHMSEAFGTPVGLSDHTMGVGVAIASVALGATIIEKHLTLRRSDGGPDAHFSMEPHEMSLLVDACRSAWESIGKVKYRSPHEDAKFLSVRRSLYVVQAVKAGQEITEQNVRSIRPGLGLAPRHFARVVGKKFSKNLMKGTPLSWDDFH